MPRDVASPAPDGRKPSRLLTVVLSGFLVVAAGALVRLGGPGGPVPPTGRAAAGTSAASPPPPRNLSPPLRPQRDAAEDASRPPETLPDAARALFGRIVDEAGAPVRGADVVFTLPRSDPAAGPAVEALPSGEAVAVRRAKTDAGGRFVFLDPPREPGWTLRAWRDERVSPSLPAPPPLPGEVLDLGTIPLGPGGAVEGLVVDQEDRPVAGAQVGWSGPPRLASVRTDARGRFRLAPVPTPRVTLDARAPGLVPLSSPTVGVLPGRTTDVVLELSPTRKVSVRVVDDDDQPVAGATVHLYAHPDTGGPTWSASALTDADGSALFEAAPHLPIHGWASAEGLRLPVGATIPDPAPVRHAWIDFAAPLPALELGHLRWEASTSHDAPHGRYAVRDTFSTKETRLLVRVTAEGYEDRLVEADRKALHRCVRVPLRPATPVVVRVADPTGAPLAGARVDVVPLEGGLLDQGVGAAADNSDVSLYPTAVTDRSGRARFRSLPPGRYRVLVRHPRGATSTAEFLHRRGPPTEVAVRLPPRGGLLVEVFGPEGSPLPGLVVLARRGPHRPENLSGRTDAGGRCIFTNLDPGDWTVCVARGHVAPFWLTLPDLRKTESVARGSATVESGRTARVRLTFAGPAPGHLVLRFRADRATLRGLLVTLKGVEGAAARVPWWFTTKTLQPDVRGLLDVGLVAPGRYRVEAKDEARNVSFPPRFVEVPPGGEVQRDWVLSTGTLAGRVVDVRGRPLAGAAVLFFAGIGRRSVPVVTVRTGPDGSFRVEGVPAGEGDLWVWRHGYREWRGRGVVPPGGSAPALEVRLAEGGWVRVTLVDPNPDSLWREVAATRSDGGPGTVVQAPSGGRTYWVTTDVHDPSRFTGTDVTVRVTVHRRGSTETWSHAFTIRAPDADAVRDVILRLPAAPPAEGR